MARQQPSTSMHRLAVREILAAVDGDHTDGGGLLLRVRPDSAAWVFRYTSPVGRRREMGLGPARRSSTAMAGDSVKLARGLAHAARELLARGQDPIDERDKARDVASEAERQQKVDRARELVTLARAARAYHERVMEPKLTDRHGATWIASLENHVPPAIWNAPIDSITPPQLLEALCGVRSLEVEGLRIPETLRRVRQRLDSVFEDAMFHGRCTTNPAAAIKRKLAEAQPRGKKGELAALPYREAPSFMAQLRRHEGVAARCLEFAILTAARTNEVVQATWDEIDDDVSLWTVPAERMKARETHTVPLSAPARAALEPLRGVHATWVFPSPMLAERPLSNMGMLATLTRMGYRDRTTVHGLCRATFSTWANETGAARPDVIEACLAHQESNRIRAAYNRAQFADERRVLLEAWAAYLAHSVSNVVPLHAA